MKPREATANVHATCVRLGSAGKTYGAPDCAGILILGQSGSGKSDLALRLIGRGAELVADDRVDLFVARSALWARAPRRIAGLLEIRGLGIIELPYTEKVCVLLAVALVRRVPRFPEHGRYLPPRGLALPSPARPPLVRIVPSEVSAPDKIAAAAAAFSRDLFRHEVKST